MPPTATHTGEDRKFPLAPGTAIPTTLPLRFAGMLIRLSPSYIDDPLLVEGNDYGLQQYVPGEFLRGYRGYPSITPAHRPTHICMMLLSSQYSHNTTCVDD